ncbi:hypothetical protein THAOC_17527 [Thalassiosira oceanica]|uniref:Uncharacterized protein n=1 Tax=Thalassiosira oceanica TaxID=159749 RepID=K0S9C7_THAOC|nr:hypothetical protein THAOC_17527 [Thalassiosira oceanica]|eukprot:EJK61900.1 hypothetical protein THAOC_17527 [Thalassiosira oceanica]
MVTLPSKINSGSDLGQYWELDAEMVSLDSALAEFYPNPWGTDILICAMYVHPSALLALEPWRDGPGRVGFSLKAYVSSLVVGTLWAGYECIMWVFLVDLEAGDSKVDLEAGGGSTSTSRHSGRYHVAAAQNRACIVSNEAKISKGVSVRLNFGYYLPRSVAKWHFQNKKAPQIPNSIPPLLFSFSVARKIYRSKRPKPSTHPTLV